MDRRALLAVVAIVAIFATVQLGALALVAPFDSAGLQATEDPSDPTNSFVYVGAILVATAVMLAAFRFGVDGLIRLLVTVSATYLAFYVFSVLVPPLVTLAGVNVLAVVPSLALAAGLLFYPEWYVIDGAGIVMGIGAAALFGISFGVLPAVILLTVLAVYDAISVYGTEHMLTLASGVMDLKLPVVLVVPLTLSYSFLESDGDAEGRQGADTAAADGGEAATATESDPDGGPEPAEAPDPLDRDAFFIGLGDAVMPAVLVASAGFFAPGGVDYLVSGLALTLPALTAMVGTLLGLVVLMYQVAKGQAHAGLPLLNGGAIGGYLLGSLAAGVSLVQALGLGPYL
ncbi:presenilin family intramembrane aspartyl protease [Salinirubellus salinus]|uniref:Presenilin family intramembrane aspartyl protease n=1 Tax=Salinirubellus salinus TaxID=1364945 RepID=A0A9E7U5F9_9EURY|nr:presenilin family intramembrane aspartyl protease PSH [Salinirubellus salinus]UWM55350.1 presenilin family intramembrane aspartyl protease [Salinirubellus salinus]